MRPIVPHRREADRRYVIGEVYSLGEEAERSERSHKHFFACVREAWKTLPEDLGDTYPTAEHLRKKALIATGYRDERMIVCDLTSEAARVAAFVQPLDDFAIVSQSGAVVRVWTAKSQSIAAMGRAEFQASKDAVLRFCADLIGVEPAALSRNVKEAA